jgi:hypothetical protein
MRLKHRRDLAEIGDKLIALGASPVSAHLGDRDVGREGQRTHGEQQPQHREAVSGAWRFDASGSTNGLAGLSHAGK